MRDGVRDHLDRAAEVQRADDDGSAPRVAPEERAAEGDEDRDAEAGAALSASIARIWIENSCSRGLRSPTSSLARV
jgi:hypothetical protein